MKKAVIYGSTLHRFVLRNLAQNRYGVFTTTNESTQTPQELLKIYKI